MIVSIRVSGVPMGGGASWTCRICGERGAVAGQRPAWSDEATWRLVLALRAEKARIAHERSHGGRH